MINRRDVRVLLRQPLLALRTEMADPFATLLATKTEWENREFTPPAPENDREVWLRETFFPGPENLVGSNTLQLNGYIQYDVFTPAGSGTKRGDEIAQVIANKYPCAKGLVNEDATPRVSLSILNTDVTSAIKEGVWRMLPVHVTFIAFGVNVP